MRQTFILIYFFVLTFIWGCSSRPEMMDSPEQRPDFKDEFYLESDSGRVFVIPEQLPKPTTVAKIIYPDTAMRRGIQGTVYIACIIDTLGKVADATIIRGIGGGCDESALKSALESEFTVAKYKGKAVISRILVPIRFRLYK